MEYLDTYALVLSITLCSACGDSGVVPGGQNSTTAASTGTVPALSASSSSGTATPTPTGSSTTMDTSQGGSSSGAPSTDVVISGIVVDLTGNTPVADRELSIYGMPGLEQVSDAQGEYTIGPVPAMSDIAVLVAPSANPPAFLGAVVPVRTFTDSLSGVALPQVVQFALDAQLEAVADQDVVPADLGQSIVIAIVAPGSTAAVATGGVTVTMDPPPAPGTFYASTPGLTPASSSLIVNTTTILSSSYPAVLFYNLPETNPGEISITASHDSWTCAIDAPVWPTVNGHTTIVSISCVQ